MALNVVKCTSCGRLTPTKHGECIYCQTNLGARARRVAKGTAAPGVGPPGAPPMHEEPRTLGGRSKRFTRRSDDRTHYLIVGSREPIKLSPGQLFVLGRDPRASLVVHAPDVSRQHAEIEWDDHDPPRAMLGEVRSSNGTFLNGKRVTRDAPQPLRSGDEVRLGETFCFTYLHVAEHELKNELEERGRLETRRFRKEDLATPEGLPLAAATTSLTGSGIVARDALEQLVAAMSPGNEGPLPQEGSLATLSGGELLQRLHRQGSTGLLSLWSGTHTGELLLQEGRCLRARFATLTGRAAMEHVAGLNQGLYRFAPDGTLAQRSAAFDEPLPGPDPAATTVIPTLRHGPPPGATLRIPPRPTLNFQPQANEGDLGLIGGYELLRQLQQEGRSGLLTILDGRISGQVAFVDGLAEQAQLGDLQGQAALEYLAEMQHGTWSFRAQAAAPPRTPRGYGPPPGPARRPGPPATRTSAPLRRVMPLRKQQAPEGHRPPLRPPSGVGPVDGPTSGPLRRPAPPPPVRPTPPRPGVPRRRPPPLPHRPDA